MKTSYPKLGFGLGLRTRHYQYIFDNNPSVDWFEIVSENFMDTDGKPKRNLAKIKELYPIVMHGISMSIGTVDPLNLEYLAKLKALIDWVNPAWVSDHLCWTGVAHKNTHDLLPVPYTEASLKHIVSRIKQVQDFLERPIAFENPSTYLEFKYSTMPEAEFIARMAEESACNLLLDVNNVYVTCYNHRLDPKLYIDALPLDKVIQIHLSGHSNKGTHIIDTHDNHVIDEVWNIYEYVLSKSGTVPNTMIEWDDNIPDFPVVYAELEKARSIASNRENYTSKYTLQNANTKKIPQVSNNGKSLLAIQSLMQEAITMGEKFNSDPDSWIVSKEGFLPSAQLSVYVNAYRYRLYDITAEDYPVLLYYLGKEKFRRLLWSFVNEVQPDHFNIARYTIKLPDFIAKKLPEDIFAQEICYLETIIAQLKDPEETEALEQKHISDMTPELLVETVLYPRKALKLVRFDYPVNSYYCSVMEEKTPNIPIVSVSYLAIFRHDDVVWRMELEEEEYKLLSKIFSGVNIGDALQDFNENITEKISFWFSRWIRNGLLAAYK